MDYDPKLVCLRRTDYTISFTYRSDYLSIQQVHDTFQKVAAKFKPKGIDANLRIETLWQEHPDHHIVGFYYQFSILSVPFALMSREQKRTVRNYLPKIWAEFHIAVSKLTPKGA